MRASAIAVAWTAVAWTAGNGSGTAETVIAACAIVICFASRAIARTGADPVTASGVLIAGGAAGRLVASWVAVALRGPGRGLGPGDAGGGADAVEQV